MHMTAASHQYHCQNIHNTCNCIVPTILAAVLTWYLPSIDASVAPPMAILPPELVLLPPADERRLGCSMSTSLVAPLTGDAVPPPLDLTPRERRRGLFGPTSMIVAGGVGESWPPLLPRRIIAAAKPPRPAAAMAAMAARSWLPCIVLVLVGKGSHLTPCRGI